MIKKALGYLSGFYSKLRIVEAGLGYHLEEFSFSKGWVYVTNGSHKAHLMEDWKERETKVEYL